MSELLNPKDFIITRKRKQYKFALFSNSDLCMEYADWDKSFAPNVLEIGAGTGLFSAELARRHADWRVAAIDVKGDRLQKGARLATEQGTNNVRFLRTRGDQLLELFEPGGIDTLWVTFPDPHPKKRSAGRRLMHPTFLRIYAQLLSSDGALYFKTDSHQLFTWTLEQLVAEKWRLDEISFDLHDTELADDYKIMTTYEQKFTAEGLPTHFVKAYPPVAAD